MARSGQIAVETAGTAVRGPDVPGKEFLFALHPDNAGSYGWVGNDGANDVASDSGFPLVALVSPTVIVHVNNLNEMWFDVQTNGDAICWLKIR